MVASGDSITVRRLTPDDAAAYQQLRLEALRESPSAFGASYEEECDLAAEAIAARLAPKADRGPFAAFHGAQPVGLVALGRENHLKLSHKAMIWGLYVTPAARGQGVGRALLQAALALASSVPQIRQVNLCVNASNAAAIRLYESLGFQTFGHEADAMLIDGVLHDELHMSLRLR